MFKSFPRQLWLRNISHYDTCQCKKPPVSSSIKSKAHKMTSRKRHQHKKWIDIKLNISLAFLHSATHSWHVATIGSFIAQSGGGRTNIRRTSSPRICSFLFVSLSFQPKDKKDLSMHEQKRKAIFFCARFYLWLKAEHPASSGWKWKFILCITSFFTVFIRLHSMLISKSFQSICEFSFLINAAIFLVPPSARSRLDAFHLLALWLSFRVVRTLTS